jgi:hypothetical protein
MLSKEGALEPEDAERIGLMLSIITHLDSQVSVELDVAHTVREKFATFGRMSLKVFSKYSGKKFRIQNY